MATSSKAKSSKKKATPKRTAKKQAVKKTGASKTAGKKAGSKKAAGTQAVKKTAAKKSVSKRAAGKTASPTQQAAKRRSSNQRSAKQRPTKQTAARKTAARKRTTNRSAVKPSVPGNAFVPRRMEAAPVLFLAMLAFLIGLAAGWHYRDFGWTMTAATQASVTSQASPDAAVATERDQAMDVRASAAPRGNAAIAHSATAPERQNVHSVQAASKAGGHPDSGLPMRNAVDPADSASAVSTGAWLLERVSSAIATWTERQRSDL